jgi:hypothetical protein
LTFEDITIISGLKREVNQEKKVATSESIYNLKSQISEQLKNTLIKSIGSEHGLSSKIAQFFKGINAKSLPVIKQFITDNLNTIITLLNIGDVITNISRKAPLYCILIYALSLTTAQSGELKIILENSKGEIIWPILRDTQTFSYQLVLDARQFITVQRFTKFRNNNDNALFLFHGVGTGKTLTSLSIAISSLSDNNLFPVPNIFGTVLTLSVKFLSEFTSIDAA